MRTDAFRPDGPLFLVNPYRLTLLLALANAKACAADHTAAAIVEELRRDVARDFASPIQGYPEGYAI